MKNNTTQKETIIKNNVQLHIHSHEDNCCKNCDGKGSCNKVKEHIFENKTNPKTEKKIN